MKPYLWGDVLRASELGIQCLGRYLTSIDSARIDDRPLQLQSGLIHCEGRFMATGLEYIGVRKPLALANWKMGMTVAECLAFVRDFKPLTGSLLKKVDVVVCPPFTALWPVFQEVKGFNLHLGAQNMAASLDPAHTGQISAHQLVDSGCRWVILGHWEVRRQQGDDDEVVNKKLRLALEAGLLPILLVGESEQDGPSVDASLASRLDRLLHGALPEVVERIGFMYEPEVAIGAAALIEPEHAARGCALIRGWIAAEFGKRVGDRVRIIYGGKVSPKHAAGLLSASDIDGLGIGSAGREALRFTQIVRQIAQVKLGYDEPLL